MTGRVAAALAAGALVAVTALPRSAGAAALAVPASDRVRVQPFAVYDTARDTVVTVTAPASFSVPVAITPGMRLLSAVAVPDHVWTTDVGATAAPIRFRVVFESDGADVPLYERAIDIAARPSDHRWFDFGRDLTALAGRRGRLRFEATSERPDAPATLALWAPPELAECGRALGVAPSVLLVTVDALRADHLGSAGYARPTSPYLDRFAAEGTRFTAAFAGGPKTIPSIPQILTGTYFFRHRETPGLGTLLGGVAESAGGISARPRFERSRAVVNNPFVASWLGAERPGFDSLVAGDLDARAITSAALRWLSATGTCRTALYLHYLDTHTPYHAPPRYARRFVDRAATTSVGLTFADVTGAWQGRYAAADRARIIDLYDGSIAWTDRQLGRLFRGLTRRGLGGRTVVIVTADHGEELWDHGHFFHGQSLYDELLHVPLLVRIPDGAPGRVVDELVSSVDIVPTIVDAASGTAAPPAAPGDASDAAARDGTSLVPLLRGTRDAPAPHAAVFATVSNAEPRAPARQSVRTATMKVVHDVEDGRIEVYDLPRDPHEQRNLGGVAPGAAELVRALDGFRHRLDGRGMQLRVHSSADHPIDYVIRLASDPPVPIVEPDRIGLERGVDRVSIGDHSSTLALSGTIDPGDDDQIRTDVLSATGTLRVSVTLDDAPAPAGTVRIGAGAKIADGNVDLADPALAGAPASAGDRPPAVTLLLWRATSATPESAPAIDPSARERLRSLGYVE